MMIIRVYSEDKSKKRYCTVITGSKQTRTIIADKNDLWTVCEKLAPVLQDILWMADENPPHWIVEAKRQAVFNNAQCVIDNFGFNRDEIDTLAAVYTNDLSRPIDLMNFMCEGASLETLDKIGLLDKIPMPTSAEIIDLCEVLRTRFNQIKEYREKALQTV